MKRDTCCALLLVCALWLAGCSGATGAPAAASAASGPSAAVPAQAAEGRAVVGGAPPRAASAPDTSIDLRRDILRVIGSAACRDDSQCRVIALGSKPCGGPEGYAAWSTAATDARELEALAARFKEARHARNQRLGLISDCAVVPEPAVRCVPAADAAVGGRCQALPARGGPLPATR